MATIRPLPLRWSRFMNDYGSLWLLQPDPAVVLTPRYVIGLLAFLICIDMTQVLGVLCYQLFLGTYFPWHLYPLMLNRAIELLALLCSDGHVPSVYSMAQVFLTILSMVICIQKEPCGRFNCVAVLVLYGLLLSYEIFVAAMVIKISHIPILGMGDEGNRNRTWLQDFERQRTTQQSINEENVNMLKDYDDVIVAVQQPDGEKYAIARLCKKIETFPKEIHYAETSSRVMQKEPPYRVMQEPSQGKQKEVVSQVTHDPSMEIESNKNIYEIGSSTSTIHDGSQGLQCLEGKPNIETNIDMLEGSTSMVSSSIHEDEFEDEKFLLNLTAEIISLVLEGGASHENMRYEDNRKEI